MGVRRWTPTSRRCAGTCRFPTEVAAVRCELRAPHCQQVMALRPPLGSRAADLLVLGVSDRLPSD